MGRADPDPFRAPVLVLSDGPLRYLTGLGYAARLALLSQLTLPRTVLEQLARVDPRLVLELHDIPNLFVADPPRSCVEQACQAGIADPGAAAAAGLALDTHGVVVLDEAADQRGAARLGLPLANSLGLLQHVHSLGLDVRSLRQDLLRLEQAGFSLSPRLQKALHGGAPAALRRALSADAVNFDWTVPGPQTARPAASGSPELEELER